MRYITPRKAASGLGSAHTGTHDHWAMTVSSVALAILTPLFLWAVGSAIGKGHAQVLEHFSRPLPALITGLYIVVGMLHFVRGTRMTIEDYLQGGARKGAVLAAIMFAWAVMAAGIYALVKMALVGMLV